MDFLNYNSVETLPGFEARAAFLCRAKRQGDNPVNSASVFREDVDIVPTIIDDTLSYVPWGGDNQMPFDLLALVEKDVIGLWAPCFAKKLRETPLCCLLRVSSIASPIARLCSNGLARPSIATSDPDKSGER